MNRGFWISLLTYSAIPVVIWLISILVKRSNEKEELENKNKEHIIVCAPKFYKIVGLLDIIFFLCCSIMTFLSINGVKTIFVGGDIWTAFAFWIFILLGIVILLFSVFRKLHLYVNENYFIYTTMFGRSYKIKYSDIISIKRTTSSLHIKTKVKFVYVDLHYKNINYLFKVFDKNGV